MLQVADATPFPFPLTGAFEPSTTALLVIDFQRDFVDEGGYMSQCGYDVSVLAEPMPRVARVLRSARDRGLRVFHTRQYSTSDDKPAVAEYPSKRMGMIDVDLDSTLKKGAAGFEIHPLVAPVPGEVVIDKVACSAFIGTDLEEKLKERRVDKLIICGITLDVRTRSQCHLSRTLECPGA